MTRDKEERLKDILATFLATHNGKPVENFINAYFVEIEREEERKSVYDKEEDVYPNPKPATKKIEKLTTFFEQGISPYQVDIYSFHEKLIISKSNEIVHKINELVDTFNHLLDVDKEMGGSTMLDEFKKRYETNPQGSYKRRMEKF